ncbi:isoprenoid synthase domain-containing protein [Fomes fomentarius]|nr:isoprenoid synthase domain-containing protein [Fomes fomentarius]
MLSAWRRCAQCPLLSARFPQTSRPYAFTRTLATVSSSSESGVADPGTYCRDYVQKRDYESYLIGSFYPRELQPAFFALRAFYVELASVQDTVSNSMIGKMRMQFWRDAIKSIADGRPPQHPIALALHDASRRADLPAYHLRRIIDARDAELHSPTHLTVESLTAHAESTTSTFLYLLLSMLNLSSSSTFSHAASHLGVAQCIHVFLRAFPYHVSKGRLVVPAELAAKHGVRQEDVFRRGGNAEGISDAVFEFATVANDNLLTAREMFKKNGEGGGNVPRRAMPVFLYGLPTRDYLGRLEAVDFDAFHPSLQVRDWKLPWRIWRGYFRGEF